MSDPMYSGAGAAPAMSPNVGMPVELPMRFVGVLIDWIPTLLLGLVIWVPFVGPVLGGLVGAAYWLLRDIKGASPGKLVLKERVVMKDGLAADQKALIMRNITIAAPSLCLAIPVAGYILGPVVALAALITEIVFLATKGERLGDQIAGTKVIKVA